jgi:nicotinate-nucleotide pyrophosphorylase (carboxylating)
MTIIRKLLEYLDEDMPFGDVTSAVIIPDVSAEAEIISKAEGIIAGLEESSLLFGHLGLTVRFLKKDGDPVKPGDLVMTVSGSAGNILTAERTCLNIISRMSAIATKTDRIASLVRSSNPNVRIAATRKTAPGLRYFDKKAVMAGGGDPHRDSLSDGFLIKDNHLLLCPLKEAILKAKKYSVYKKIEVEVEKPADALIAVEAGADIILLDNMTPEDVILSSEMLNDAGLRKNVILEVSGGITPENIESYAVCDIDIISIGALTHTVECFDVSLNIRGGKKSA